MKGIMILKLKKNEREEKANMVPGIAWEKENSRIKNRQTKLGEIFRETDQKEHEYSIIGKSVTNW